jgi:hypothetical protein
VLVVYQYQCNTHTQSCFVWVVKPGSSERSNFQESALHKAATKLHIENFTWIAWCICGVYSLIQNGTNTIANVYVVYIPWFRTALIQLQMFTWCIFLISSSTELSRPSPLMVHEYTIMVHSYPCIVSTRCTGHSVISGVCVCAQGIVWFPVYVCVHKA